MTVRAVFLWHLHQPDYRDPTTGHPLLPWVRLHACRAYTDMAVALERHPEVRAVVNFAPSLLLQLEDFVAGRAVDLDEELGRRPPDTLTPAERAHVLKDSFSANWDLWVRPVARYWELLSKRGADLRGVDLLRAQEAFSDQELLDLQVHFCLAWMGFHARKAEPLVAELLKKERGFSQAEKVGLLDLQRRLAADLPRRYRDLAERGQIELTCSPLDHPILPLLIDTDSARRAMPEVRLPPRFQHPDDARAQVVRGLDVAERIFGRRPVGMWPSEGSVSPEVIDLLATCGVRWCATDQGVLERSDVDWSGEPPPAGFPSHLRALRAGSDGQVSVLFRDRELSDFIGFRYAQSDPGAGADDLLRRLGSAPDGSLVTVALDGENPWEHYRGSGEEFLEALYTRLAKAGGRVQTVLPKDELAARPPKARISRLHSGSWIDACYRIWIGHPEDNQGWTLIGQARAALAEAEASGTLTAEALERARSAMYAAEGSDWFWWYGDDFHTDHAPEFDLLFRRHLEGVYRALGRPVPERLGRPIIGAHKDRTQQSAVLHPPRRLIHPVVDGYSRGFYEWAGAGVYRPGSSTGSSMYRGTGVFGQLMWGFSLQHLFVRLDPLPGAALSGELKLLFARERPLGALPWPHAPDAGPLPVHEEKTVSVRLGPEGGDLPLRDDRGLLCGLARCGAIVEANLSLSALGVAPGDRVAVTLRLLREEVEADRLPRYGDLELNVPDRSFEQIHWQV